MAGKRVKDLTGSQDYFDSNLVLLVDKIDTGSGDWLLARKMSLGLLGNTRFQGSINQVNWHDEILDEDIYYRFSTDGGTQWIYLVTDSIAEGESNLFFTEARVLAITEIADLIADTHAHTNLTLLETLVDNGAGTLFLSDDGTYKARPETPIATKLSNYVLSSSDEVILVDGTTQSIVITLPSATGISGKQYTIKCINNDHTCQLYANAVQIDGSTDPITMSEMESITVIAQDNKWWII